MNSRKQALYGFLVLLVSSITTQVLHAAPQTFVGCHGQLKVAGNRIVDASGQVITLRGMSMYPWATQGLQYYNATAISRLVNEWKCTVLRIPILPGSVGTQESLVKTVVDACIANGIYAIIDWHSMGGANSADCSAFMKRMATAYGNTPNVMYELWNEPVTEPWSTIKAYHEQVIAAIRTIDPDKIIFCGDPSWDQSPQLAANDPITTFKNIVYVVHFYAASHGQWLRDNVTTALNKGVAIFATEYGTGTADGNGNLDTASTQAWWDFLDANGVGCTNWSVSALGEESAAFYTGTSATTWTDANLKPSGVLVKNHIVQMNTPLFGACGASTPVPTSTFTRTIPTATFSFTATRTNTPVPPTSTRTNTATATSTMTSTRTNSPVPPTFTFTSTATRTNTPVPPTATRTNTATATSTMTSTRTNSPVPPTFTFTSTATRTNTPVPPTATRTNTATATSTMTSTRTNSPVPPTFTFTSTATNTAVPPTLTNTPVPPTLTNTPAPPTATNTPALPTLTDTPLPPTFTSTATNTVVPPTVTDTPAPPTVTDTPVPPTATNSPVPPTLTSTTVPPTFTSTATYTAVPPTFTDTPVPPTVTDTPAPPTATNTPVAPTGTFTATRTNTPVPPTATRTNTATATSTMTSTRTNTLVPPTVTFTFTATRTNTPVPPTATRTNTATATSTMTSTRTNTPVPPTATPVPPTPTFTVVTGTGSFTVDLLSSVTSDSTNSPNPQIEVINTGSVPLNLNNVEVRYWLNCDCTNQSIQAWVDWAGLIPVGTSVTGDVLHTVQTTSLGGQTDYISYKFTGNLVLQPGQTIQIRSRFNKNDWSNMLQDNDWSFAPYTSFTPWTHVTGYLNGSLVWGLEPSATTSTLKAASVVAYPNPSTGNGVNLAVNMTGSGLGTEVGALTGVDPAAQVSLKVYTLAERMIWSTTVSGASIGSTGNHTVYWNGKDLSGANLANGIYIAVATVKSNDQTSTSKSKIMILR